MTVAAGAVVAEDMAMEMTLVSWGGAYQASQHKAYVEPYLAANPGVTVTWDESSGEAVAKLRAMDEAEQALRGDDLAEAIDRQSEAMEALREGMRSLGEAMAQNQQNQPGQGTQDGDMQANNRDPLGRNPGAAGSRMRTCCRAKTCTAARGSCWTKSVAGPENRIAPRSNWNT